MTELNFKGKEFVRNHHHDNQPVREGINVKNADGADSNATRKCKHCAAPLPVNKSPRALFCNTECRVNYKVELGKQEVRAARSGRTCPRCRGVIPPSRNMNAVFCSRICHYEHHKSKMRDDSLARRDIGKRECRACGADIPPSRRKGVIYCDSGCQAKWWAARGKRNTLDKRAAAQRKCAYCGEGISVERSSTARFCSAGCKNSADLDNGKGNKVMDADRRDRIRHELAQRGDNCKGCRILIEFPSHHIHKCAGCHREFKTIQLYAINCAACRARIRKGGERHSDKGTWQVITSISAKRKAAVQEFVDKHEIDCSKCDYLLTKVPLRRDEHYHKCGVCGRYFASTNANALWHEKCSTRGGHVSSFDSRRRHGNARAWSSLDPFKKFAERAASSDNRRGIGVPPDQKVTAEVLRRIWEDQQGKCILTGRKMILPASYRGFAYLDKSRMDAPLNASLDQIAPSAGHGKDNVRWVILLANYGRHHWDDQVFWHFMGILAGKLPPDEFPLQLPRAPRGRGDHLSPFRYFMSRKSSSIGRQLLPPDGKELTPVYLYDLWNKQAGRCDLSGVRLILPSTSNDWGGVPRKHPAKASLDRIDGNKGYWKGNVRWTSLIGNFLKHSWDDAVVRKVAQDSWAHIQARLQNELADVRPSQPSLL